MDINSLIDPKGERRALVEKTRRAENIASLAEAILELDGSFGYDEKGKSLTGHYFAAGAYVRTWLVEKDQLVVGRVHKNPCISIIAYGDVTISSPEGVQRLEGFNIFESPGGQQRALYGHEETMFITCHAHEEDDPDKMIEHLTYPTREEYLEYKRKLLEDKS